MPTIRLNVNTVGTRFFPAGTTQEDQFVIPRYHDGTNYPSGNFQGRGAQTCLVGTDATSAQSVKAIIKTEDFGGAISQWQYPTSPGYLGAIKQPGLYDCTVMGYHSNYYASGLVDANPEIWNTTSTDKYGGYFANGSGGNVHDVNFYYIPGLALYFARPQTALQAGPLPYDSRLKWNINNIGICRVFRGIYNNATDSYMTDIEVQDFRDYGVRIGTYHAGGAVQYARVHCYGGGMLASLNSAIETINPGIGLQGVDSPSIWVDGSDNHGSDCYGENSPIGVLFTGDYNTLKGLYAHTCSVACVVMSGTQNVLSASRLEASAVGVKLANQYNTVNDCYIGVSGNDSKGVQLTNGTGQIVTNCKISQYANTMSCVTTASTGSGTDATLTFAAQAEIPFPVGTSITVSGIVPTGYRGTFTVTACTTTTVTYANTTTGSMSTAGAVSSTTQVGTGISVESSLTNCLIDGIVVVGGRVGINLSGGVGVGNTIRVKTANGITGAVPRPVILPSNYGTEPKNTTSFVEVNGIRYYPITDEFDLDSLLYGLMAWYKFDETSGTSAADSSGNGRTGTLTSGAVFNSAGKFGTYALLLDGVNDHMLGPSVAGPQSGYTFAAWVNRDTEGDYAVVGMIGGSGYRHNWCYIDPTGAIVFTVFGIHDANWISRIGGDVPIDTWTHIACTWNGSNSGSGIRIYVNGVEVATSNNSSGTFTGASVAPATIVVGDRPSSGNGFHGLIDDARFYDRMLNPDQIAALYAYTP